MVDASGVLPDAASRVAASDHVVPPVVLDAPALAVDPLERRFSQPGRAFDPVDLPGVRFGFGPGAVLVVFFFIFKKCHVFLVKHDEVDAVVVILVIPAFNLRVVVRAFNLPELSLLAAHLLLQFRDVLFPNLRLASAADADAGTRPLLAPLSALRRGSLALDHRRAFHRRSVLLVAALEDGARIVPGSHASPRRRRRAALFLPGRTGRLFVGLVLITFFFRAAALAPALSFLSFPQPPRPRGRRLGDDDRVDRDGRRGIDVVRRGRLLRRRRRRVFVFVFSSSSWISMASSEVFPAPSPRRRRPLLPRRHRRRRRPLPRRRRRTRSPPYRSRTPPRRSPAPR